MDEKVRKGFDTEKYLKLQKESFDALLGDGDGARRRVYVEIGGKLLHDGHASRVLPGFAPDVKLRLVESIVASERGSAAVLLCVGLPDCLSGRVWETGRTYSESLASLLMAHRTTQLPTPTVVLNMCSRDPSNEERELLDSLHAQLVAERVPYVKRYVIDGYPNDIDRVLRGFEKDEEVRFDDAVRVVFVTALGSSCGKLSTALGQLHAERRRGVSASYAKLELFPIARLPVRHPINLAYEAATADVGDYNLVDTFHVDAHPNRGHPAPVNYNRDVEAFPVVLTLLRAVGVTSVLSPTMMGINRAAEAITDCEECCAASVREIRRRAVEYADRGLPDATARCHVLAKRAEAYREVRLTLDLTEAAASGPERMTGMFTTAQSPDPLVDVPAVWFREEQPAIDVETLCNKAVLIGSPLGVELAMRIAQCFPRVVVLAEGDGEGVRELVRVDIPVIVNGRHLQLMADKRDVRLTALATSSARADWAPVRVVGTFHDGRMPL